jgi:hypothetical protein
MGRGADIVNTYDPMDRMVYRHLDAGRTVSPTSISRAQRVDRLPSGYANSSPQTFLRRARRVSTAA